MDDPEMVTVRSLVGAGQAGQAAVCLGSLLAAARRPVRLAIHDDGTLDAVARAHLTRALGPACAFVDQAEAAGRVGELLRRHERCRRFRDGDLFGPKLFDVPLLAAAAGERAIYVDSDILWTRPCDCPAFFTSKGGPAGGFVVMCDLRQSYAVAIRKWHLLGRNGVRLVSRFCAGMMSFDPAAGGYDLDYVEFLLGLDARTGLFNGFRYWTEQTIYAALAAQAGRCAWIDPAECLVAHRRDYPRRRGAAVIHFAGSSRGLLAGRWREIDRAAFPTAATTVLDTVPAPVCGLGRRLLSAAWKRLWLVDGGAVLAGEEVFGLTPVAESVPQERVAGGAEGKAS